MYKNLLLENNKKKIINNIILGNNKYNTRYLSGYNVRIYYCFILYYKIYRLEYLE